MKKNCKTYSTIRRTKFFSEIKKFKRRSCAVLFYIKIAYSLVK